MGERIMAGESREKIVIDPNTLLIQAQELAKYIEALKSALAGVENTRANLKQAMETIEALKDTTENVLVPADHGGIAFFWAKPVSTDKIILHIGREYFAVIPRNEALQKLERRLDTIEKQETEIRKKLDEALQQYQALQSLLQQVAAAMRTQAQQKQKTS